MRFCVVGAALQGLETIYLAHKSGHEVVAIDMRENAPAAGLAEEFIKTDAVRNPDSIRSIVKGCDAVIPACEDMDVFIALERLAEEAGIPVLADFHSFALSRSKERSNIMLSCQGIPVPEPWPECGFPAIVKPSSKSCGIGVSIVNDDDALNMAIREIDSLRDVPVIQEYVSGRDFSLDVIGVKGRGRSYAVTEIIQGAGFGCKRVVCGPDLMSGSDEIYFKTMAEKVSLAIGLDGPMNIEVIMTNDGPKVLEFDAYIPSQTPTAVLAATGVNLLQELYDSKVGKTTGANATSNCSSVEYLHVHDNMLRYSLKRMFARVRSPKIVSGLFGSDEMITDYEPGKKEWYAEAIIKGRDPEEIYSKRNDMVERILKECKLKGVLDSPPIASPVRKHKQ